MTVDKLREALELIANFSDVEMGDGDGARKVALEALAATAAPSGPVGRAEQAASAQSGWRPIAEAKGSPTASGFACACYGTDCEACRTKRIVSDPIMPRGNLPGLYLDSGEFVPAEELK